VDAKAARALLRASQELQALQELRESRASSEVLAMMADADEAAAQRKRLMQARRELLGALQRRAGAHGQPRGAGTALVRAGAEAAPIVAVGPASEAVVIVQSKLAEVHPAPWWVLPVRLSILAGSIATLPARGTVLWVLVAAIWVVSGFVVRYSVQLPPGRALYRGGISNTGTPGTHWLRRRWFDSAHSISTEPLHIDWRPAPTRLEQGEVHCWLELELELWVEPRTDDVGQFVALLNYHSWQDHPRAAARKLRDDVLDAVVGYVRDQGLVGRGAGSPVRLDGEVEAAIDAGLHKVGLERGHVGKRRITLLPHTDDLSTEDRLWIDHRPPPGV
jgi:hypothetical protein